VRLGTRYRPLFFSPLDIDPPGKGDSPVSSPGSARSPLSTILNRALRYCRRLENAALDFVCLEEISEKIDLSRDAEDEVYVPLNRGIKTQIRSPNESRKTRTSTTFNSRGRANSKGKTESPRKNGKAVKEKDGPSRDDCARGTMPFRPLFHFFERFRFSLLSSPFRVN